MGKPDGFFKKLKAKQKRTASQQRRGTKGASKEERRQKYNERVEYYAAKRQADELDALSDSSEDKVSTDSEKEKWSGEKKLRKLRNLLGLAKHPQRSRNAAEKGADKSVRGPGGKTSVSAQKHLRDGSPKDEDDDLDSEGSLHLSGELSSSQSSVGRVPRVDRDGRPDSQESSVASGQDWETYLGRATTPTSESGSSETDGDEGAPSDDQEEEELLMDYDGDDEEDIGGSESLDLDEDEEVEEEEAEANPLFELLNEDEDGAELMDDSKGEIVFEPQDTVGSSEETYVDDDSDNSSGSSSAPGAPLVESVEKQRERRALLPKFKLGTTSMNTILHSNAKDRCYQKYHLDQHGGVDQTPLRMVPVRPEVLEALEHSNDALIAAVEASEKVAEADRAHGQVGERAITSSLNSTPPRAALAQDLLAVSAAEYRMVNPSNIAVAASAHAQKCWLHEPFDVDVGDQSVLFNSRTKTPATALTSRKRGRKEDTSAALDHEAMESRLPYLHETLWAKWVAYRRSYPRNHHFPPSPSHAATDTLPVLTFEERGLLDLLQGYPDVLDCVRCWQNGASRRDIFLLHILNHWFKMRAVVVAHDAILHDRRHRRRTAINGKAAKKKPNSTAPVKSSKNQEQKRRRQEDGQNGSKPPAAAEKILNSADDEDDGDDDLELRDRGFGKTRVLVMLPMRNQAYRYVHTIVRILGADPERCPKLDNFSSDFTEIEEAVDPTFKRRPKDYQRQFEGNIDDAFCVGLRIEPDRVHVYAHPLNSDIILCSPLGLRRRLEKSGDIMVSLSSIEVCLVDEAHVLLEQNWDHVAAVLGMLNKRPTDTTHGLSDLRRVYAWALEGKSGRHRQTIFSTNISHATISSAFRASLNNSGKVLLQHRVEEGVLSHVLAPVRQNFIRFDAPTIESVDDERFDVFTNKMYQAKIHPLVERNVRTIIFVPSYFQFVRLRNYMHREYRESYAAISEYTSVKKQRQALGQFTDLERPLLLLTERFYFFRRYFVKFAEIVIFYSPPLFPEFYSSLVNRIVATSPNAFAMTLYCRYDTHELSRIVGTKRAATLLERESGIFSFVTS